MKPQENFLGFHSWAIRFSFRRSLAAPLPLDFAVIRGLFFRRSHAGVNQNHT